jgi:quercetin dioxygenase-like cupin family protein
MKLRTERFRGLFLVILVGCTVTVAKAQADKPMVTTLATSKFGGLPVLPACATFAVEKGDPNKGPSILLIKATSGCVVPWHWHTAAEQLMFVSGVGKIEMQDGQPHALNKGDFALLPAQHHHQFTCTTNCLFFNSIEGAFDIHYIDKSGKEIPPEQSLKTASPAKTPAKK